MRVHLSLALLLTGGLWLLAPGLCLAQTGLEEAKARMAAQAAKREAERAKPVQTTAGELEDLHAKIKMLEAQNAELKKKIELTTAAAAATATPAKKKYTNLEVGMTRDEAMAYIASRKDLRVFSQSISSGASPVVGGGGVGAGGVGGAGVGGVGGVGGGGVSPAVQPAKVETIVLSVLSARTVQTGAHRNAIGGTGGVIKEYGTETFESGRIKVELVNDVVSGLADVPLRAAR